MLALSCRGVKLLNINIGQIVISKAGRDKGKKMIVITVVNESYVLIADGVLRKIEKPKKKKIKHIAMTDKINKVIEEKILRNKKILNSDIKKVLNEDGEKIV